MSTDASATQTSGSPASQAREPYRLSFPPDGTSVTARDNLADMLERELLGPSDGDAESITDRPDNRYLIGRIAPVKLHRTAEVPRADTDDTVDEEGLEAGDDLDANAGRGVPALSVDETSGDADEDSGGDRDDDPVKRGLMIPASMGLRFQVPRDLETVFVAASWGVYNPQRTGEVTAAGREKRVFVRTPIHHRVAIQLADLKSDRTTEYPLHDDVVLRVDASIDSSADHLLIEVALCNDRETPRQIPVNAWMFQTQLHVDADGAAVFLPVRDALTETRHEPNDELRRLTLQYRDRLEFAIGRTCSADWTVTPGARRATGVRTTWMPTAQTPQVDATEIPGVLLDMRALAAADVAQLESVLRPIVTGYGEWLDQQHTIAEQLPDHLRGDAIELVDEARSVQSQLAAGLDFLVADTHLALEARRCFAFMNRVMADQRIQTQVAALRVRRPALSIAEAITEILAEDGVKAHSWRTFQLAFVLMQIEVLCLPEHPRRSGDAANVELLFFPTGGGKTEAYLGLAAFTFAIRRRQQVIDSPEGSLDGRTGVAVLMRYTLRLLTAQQFQRATALICAAELERRKDETTWGTEPFRIGLWVGSNVSPKYVKDAAAELKLFHERKGGGYRLTVLQVRRCPWCGTEIKADTIYIDDASSRVLVRCGDDLADCPFSAGGGVAEGLPILTVDEEIYRLVPSFVIATVDKFARLAREGEAASLFGYVSAKCDLHGYVHPDSTSCTIAIDSKHPRTDSRVRAAGRLRPPDLIIQDELHLITGALGTTVGLFEVVIDALTTWRTASGDRVKPAIIASSATVRNAPDQVRGLYGRGVTQFPPQVLDAADTFFSIEVPVSSHRPGRKYIGVSTTGVRLTTTEIQVAQVLMAAGQQLLDSSGSPADPYMTLVAYFSSTRELAGMSRYLQDDVQTALAKGRPGSALPQRFGTDYGRLNDAELTGRVSNSDITQTLDQMATSFDLTFDSTAGRQALRDARAAHEPMPNRDVNPYDAVLATSMLQVGVDVSRLGLMMLVGQPKNTAEYIQASSRVGRTSDRPGLVVTLGNWARPRDLAHFEQFRHYHETFYAQVEPLSVTPFSVTSLERGLDGVLVSAARVLQAGIRDGLSPERNAGRIAAEQTFVDNLIAALVARIRQASDEQSAEHARVRLINRLDLWNLRRTTLGGQANLSYEREYSGKDGTYHPLMRSAESVRSRDDAHHGPPFVIANSMREVQPEINLLVSPTEENLVYVAPFTAPRWTAQQTGTSP